MTGAQPRPNILLILTDQQRWDSLGCYGADWVTTPVLDRLAADGARFDRAYCTNPICTPSRASLWTGRHLPGHGVYRLDSILPDDQVMVSQKLREAGYRTGLFGKLHVSGRIYEEARRHPNDGFDEYEWCLESVISMDSPLQAYSAWLAERNPELHRRMRIEGRKVTHVPREFHMTHWAAERSIDFIRRSVAERRDGDDRPFFCCMSVFDPHNPYEDYPIEYADRVDTAKLPRVLDDRREDVTGGVKRERAGSYLGDIDAFSDEDITRMRVGYYASLALLDDEVGEVLSALEETAVADDTLVVFASDHGDMLGDHRLLVKGAIFYDAGVRVPLIVRWPGRIASGTVVDAPVQLHDIAATIVAASGCEPPWAPHEEALTGRDLVPLARGEVDRLREDTVCLYRNTGINRIDRDWTPPLNGSMILRDDYKLSIFHDEPGDSPRGELYDMVRDPDEMHNLWDDPHHAGRRSELTLALTDWLVRNETTYLGSPAGIATVPPDQYIVNLIEPGGKE